MARIPRLMVTAEWLAQATAAGSGEAGLSPVLGAEQMHRLVHVLRLTAGAEVEVFTGDGGVWRGRLQGAADLGWRLTGLQAMAAPPPVTRAAGAALVTIACGWPRAKRADFLVEKLVELGVERLQPVVYERSERGEHFGADKLARYQRLIAQACEQSRRNAPMELLPAQPWSAVLAASAGRRFVATGAADGAAPSLSAALAGGEDDATAAITVAIGPEGGLTAAEIAAGLAAGWMPVRLGRLTLRVETAAITAAAAVLLARRD